MADRTEAAFSWSEGWNPVSPRLTSARRLTLCWCTCSSWPASWRCSSSRACRASSAWIGLGVAVVVFVWLWWLIGRRVRSFGYAERDDDLLVTSGIMFRRLVIVPYGRMQLVDVKAGPIDRRLGITTVQLHTAAATTDASIPGLEPDAAAALRDRLAKRGEQRSAGL